MNNNNNNNNNNMNQIQNKLQKQIQKQIQKQRIQKRKQTEKGKNIALSQTVKLWKKEHKLQKEQKHKQNQRHLLRSMNETNKEKTMIYVRLLFPSPNLKKKLPPCVRVNGRPKPASMKYPNMEAIRQKPKKQTKPKNQI